MIRESVILTDTWIDAGARVERAIVDKAVRIGRRARIGKAARGEKPADGLGITTIGKNAEIPDGVTVRRGTVIHTDVTAEQLRRAAGPGAGAPRPRLSGAAARQRLVSSLYTHRQKLRCPALPVPVVARRLHSSFSRGSPLGEDTHFIRRFRMKKVLLSAAIASASCGGSFGDPAG